MSFSKSQDFGEQGWRSGESSSLPTNVARVQIPASTPYVDWVCCWFSPLLREVFLRVLRFSPLLKNQHFKFQFDQESGRRRTTMWMCYLQIVIYLIYLIYEFRISLYPDWQIDNGFVKRPIMLHAQILVHSWKSRTRISVVSFCCVEIAVFKMAQVIQSGSETPFLTLVTLFSGHYLQPKKFTSLAFV